MAYFNDVQGLLDRLLGVERETSINLCRDFARNDLEDFATKLHKQAVKNSIDLLIDVATLQLVSHNPSTHRSVQRTWPLPYSTAASINLAYSGILEAAKIRVGLVVASCGLYFAIAKHGQWEGLSSASTGACIYVLAKSPEESQHHECAGRKRGESLT